MRAWLFTLLARARGFLRPDDLDRELASELDAHLAMAEEAKVQRGMPREAARREARVELGGMSQLREAGRAAQGLPWLSGAWLDLKLGARLLARYPGMTLVSTIALAIGIAIVAGFHAGTNFFVNPSLPVPEEDRVVAIWHHDIASADRGTQTVGDMLTWRAELDSIDDLGAFALYERVVTVPSGPTRLVRTAQISPSLFRALRVPPHLGRALVETDERPGAAAVALIGFNLWQSGFGGDPDVLGRTIRLGGVDHTLVGVMPEGFAFPLHEQLWTPLQPASASLAPGEGQHVEFVVGRLSPDASIESAGAELQLIGERLEADYPGTHARLSPLVTTYARSLLEANEPELPTLMSAARVAIGIVLLVVAVNVGTLVYARNASRVGEVAVRSALGASRRRIVLQMFAEALVLASLAAIVALGLIAWPILTLGNLLANADATGGVPYWFEVGIGADTILRIAGLVLVSAVLTGVLPAIKLTHRGGSQGLARMQDQSAGLRFGRTATLVVVVQVALSVALLTVAAAQLWTLARSWVAFETDGIAGHEFLTADLRWDLTPSGDTGAPLEIDDRQRRARTWRALGERLSQEPAIRGVTFSSGERVRPFALEGTSTLDRETTPWSYVALIEPNYFGVYGLSLIAGRSFGPADRAAPGTRVAIVNEEFLRRTGSRGTVVGGHVRAIDPRTGRPDGDRLEIVGVVTDVLGLDITHQGPGWRAYPTIYVPLRDESATAVRMAVHVAGEPSAVVSAMRGVAAGIDPTLVLHRPASRAERDAGGLVFVRLYGYAVGFVIFAVLLLSTAGTYSMMSFTVSQRTREIGVRTALGATPRQLVTDVFARAMRQLGAGTLLGLAVGALASNVFASSPALAQGPWLPAGLAALLLILGLAACGRPMRRALRIQPTEALREG